MLPPGWLINQLCAVCVSVLPLVVDVLGLQDSKQSVAAVEKIAGALRTLSDIYVVSTFRLPAKMGGVLMGVYSKQDNRKYLEVAVMGKINKGVGYVVGGGGDNVITAQPLPLSLTFSSFSVLPCYLVPVYFSFSFFSSTSSPSPPLSPSVTHCVCCLLCYHWSACVSVAAVQLWKL